MFFFWQVGHDGYFGIVYTVSESIYTSVNLLLNLLVCPVPLSVVLKFYCKFQPDLYRRHGQGVK